jgi:hypothetical protein
MTRSKAKAYAAVLISDPAWRSFWYNVGCGVVCVTYGVDAFRTGVDAMKMLCFGSLVIGSDVARKIVNKRYGMDKPSEK